MTIKAVNCLRNEKNSPKSNCVINNYFSESSNCLVELNLSINRKNIERNADNKFKKCVKQISPYLDGNKFQVRSRITEKKIVNKESTENMSSLSQAYEIYKAHSDESKCIKEKYKKNKMPYLTSLNKPTPIIQTVSDMNDSEYHNRVDNNRKCKPRKHRLLKKCCNTHLKTNKYEFSNGDMQKYSKMTSESSHLHVDKEVTCKSRRFKPKINDKENIRPCDVWAMLRNMNRIQCTHSPPSSDDSIETVKGKKHLKNGIIKRNDARLVETCTTEELTYISGFDVNTNAQSFFSQPSSFDRITVINMKDESKERMKCTETDVLETRILKKEVNRRDKNIRSKANKMLRNVTKNTNTKKFGDIGKEDKYLLENSSRYSLHEANKSMDYLHNEHIRSDTINFNDYVSLINALNNIVKNYGGKRLTTCLNNISKDMVHIGTSSDTFSRTSERSSKAGCMHNNNGIYFKKSRLVKTSLSAKPCLLSTVASSKGDGDFTKKTPIVKQKSRPISIIPNLKCTEIKKRFNCVKLPITEWTRDSKESSLFRNQFNINVPNIKSKCHIDYKTGNSVIFSNKINCPRSVKNSNTDDNVSAAYPQRGKVAKQLEDKMDIINKKTSTKSIKRDHIDCLNENHTNTGIETPLSISKKNANICHYEKSLSFNKPSLSMKYPWSKVKCISDFIENVLNKIMRGTYYTYNPETVNQNFVLDAGVSMKTDPNNKANAKGIAKNSMEFVSKNVEDNYKCYNIIPGFGKLQVTTSSKLEVKMLTRTKIWIYHCLTNVVIQFDINIPTVSDSIQSASLIPWILPVMAADEKENKTTVYKYKTRIMNTVLPAELCSILPKLIHQMTKEFKKMAHGSTCDATDFSLVSVHNLKKIDKPESIQRLILETKILEGGIYSKISPKIMLRTNRRKLFYLDLCQKDNLLPKYCLKIKDLLSLTNPLFIFLNTNSNEYNVRNKTENVCYNKELVNNCKALQLYVPPNKRLDFTSYSTLTLTNERIKDLQTYIYGFFNFMSVPNQYECKKKLVTPKNWLGCNIYDDFRQTNHGTNCFIQYTFNSPLKLNLYAKRYNGIYMMKVIELPSEKEKMEKIIKKTSNKPYKKCKSITNISKEVCSTSINKITNIDEFFLTFGCCKSLSGVLDGYAGKTVLSLITELKSWIKEITPVQALLILLLANKKETTNLKRFRSILLQGIALNRITTVTELDMEIEVLEKENLCVSRYEGMSFLPSTQEDNFLEELYWIAKTTASDYQTSFDESSKRLLKSLLDKRKKLSPSYLRVMARYVGLGLLKQGKDNKKQYHNIYLN
ncbi:unnamed protein product [Parnassius apollo]|uniref:(apollo) hypothetical protein n=1 Tax=Parnassius apollo TaxID=110799 RepID=A0A8S3W668_PARAO|nr:unnamed protein product [Parnassius apollo]